MFFVLVVAAAVSVPVVVVAVVAVVAVASAENKLHKTFLSAPQKTVIHQKATVEIPVPF